ncbi:hypothetical protein [Xanthomonas hortorum]|uniref:hypothetical protein n=2 Tax=Xanthomonas hortorum TaxID=56454 RepID=UPI000A898D50|nr:hypothetical protein [Xanthomonas hortorum]MCC8659470.1 hypothetical protein [Xanthomonas hortorum pv. gardneri]MCE4349228.1 hypothetical protein [Xanthomonas hortorum pv. cynarae]
MSPAPNGRDGKEMHDRHQLFLFDSAATQRRRTANHLRPATVKEPRSLRPSSKKTALQLQMSPRAIKNAGCTPAFFFNCVTRYA